MEKKLIKTDVKFYHHVLLFNPFKKFEAGVIIPYFNLLPQIGICLDRTFEMCTIKIGWLNLQLSLHIELIRTYKYIEL